MYTENRRQYSWPGSAFFPRFLGNRTPLLLFSIMWSRADILGLFSNNVVMIVIVDFEFQYRAHTGEAVEHRGDECEVPQAGDRILGN
jgi:hypothetical protein